MGKFKVGDVCEILETYPQYAAYRGMECTIVGLRGVIDDEMWYDISIKGDDKKWNIGETCLKKIEPPKNNKDEEAFRKFLDKVLQPVDNKILEEA